jgi:protein TonB
MTQPADSAYPLLRQRRSLDIFACMLAVSILLHCAASVILILPGRFSQTGPAAVFVELQNPAATPSPQEEPLRDDAVAPQPPPAAETAAETAPAASPETARLEQAVADSLRRAVQSPDAVHESAIGLGMISGHFASFAEGASLKDDIRVYYFELMRRINEVWWTGGAARGSFVNAAAVNLSISRDGKVLACELLESSGSREQDAALLDAVRTAEPLPPLPRSYFYPTFNAPIRFVPPLRLMLPGFAGKAKPSLRHGE